MNRKFVNPLHNMTLFTKLLASFILIITIVLSVQIFLNKSYISSMENEIKKNSNERLDNLVNRLDDSFGQINKMLFNISREDVFSPVLKGKIPTPYDEKLISSVFSKYKILNPQYCDIFLFVRGSDFVITPLGTYETEKFFNKFYFSDKYTEDFWIKEMNNYYIYKYLPTCKYKYYSSIGSNSNYYMPITFKKMSDPNYVLVALVDINKLAESLENNFITNLYILNSNNDILYPTETDIDLHVLDSLPNDGFRKIGNQYLFSRKSNSNPLKYIKIVPNTLIANQLNAANLLFSIVITLSFLLSIIISVYIVTRFNNPVKQITEIIKRSNILGAQENYTVDLKLIKDDIQKIVYQNSDYMEDIRRKNLTLRNYSYYESIKNIRMDIGGIDRQLSIKNSYILVYYKIHYKEAYYTQISDENKGLSMLGELLNIYVKNLFAGSITFQPESDQIISIINIENDKTDIFPEIRKIALKLKQEEDFAFFTIVISNIYTDTSELSKAYNKLFEVAKYRKLVSETQILSAENIDICSNKFYFSIEQVEHFTQLLYSGNHTESIQLIEFLLEYNIKKGINAFCIYLLSLELTNCCVKVLSGIYYDIPNMFDFTTIYAKLSQCNTPEQYKKLLGSFVSSVAGYINSNKKATDYIIDYVKNYVDNHIAEDIYLDLLADKLNITKSYLSSYFNNKTGGYLSDYINMARIRKAIELIENTTTKIQDIRLEVGISNTNTFIRLFKKYTGMAPGEYRKARMT
jgi:Response regulator containing CheY-like receiver domain and AraC-type DNA-binding domain